MPQWASSLFANFGLILPGQLLLLIRVGVSPVTADCNGPSPTDLHPSVFRQFYISIYVSQLCTPS